MNKKIYLSLGLIILFLGIVIFRQPTPNIVRGATVYRTETCGCCQLYVSYLKRNNYEVEDIILDDLTQLKNSHNIGNEITSCHTTLIDGYAFEGHLPIEVITKFLQETPADFQGIALPGMPSGSPGMPGAKLEAFKVMGIPKIGEPTKVFMDF
ncbi:MAG: CopG family transcriptional regulator [Candidatus Harrisonbacteria bacterium CG10_big_fil_rev_8_21_14_0_10_38_8]|uniref:CopG family transcriptional regulator n=1 Tax=Candidatus Harrisonbacteria bacterium CG10_big_fil_rev_8_21_14_0_10_38_8 TaxID=1974582 RepID=A0A2M6WJG7_9BACT|nr:MAG: CopG family transcriptional regulator [Candidatus Harrisonbacteria bacterium CG10_big_fil_rev_8_21_14_0_10_38_8]